MNCPDGKCDIAARIAAARAGRAGTGKAPLVGYDAGGRPVYDVTQAVPVRPDVSVLPMEQRDARRFVPRLPAAATPAGMGIGVVALVVLAIILMRKCCAKSN